MLCGLQRVHLNSPQHCLNCQITRTKHRTPCDAELGPEILSRNRAPVLFSSARGSSASTKHPLMLRSAQGSPARTKHPPSVRTRTPEQASGTLLMLSPAQARPFPAPFLGSSPPLSRAWPAPFQGAAYHFPRPRHSHCSSRRPLPRTEPCDVGLQPFPSFCFFTKSHKHGLGLKTVVAFMVGIKRGQR